MSGEYREPGLLYELSSIAKSFRLPFRIDEYTFGSALKFLNTSGPPSSFVYCVRLHPIYRFTSAAYANAMSIWAYGSFSSVRLEFWNVSNSVSTSTQKPSLQAACQTKLTVLSMMEWRMDGETVRAVMFKRDWREYTSVWDMRWKFIPPQAEP
jgi:hypothetical protein